MAVTAGPVVDRLGAPAGTGPAHEAAPGRCLLRLPGVGRFLVEAAEAGAVRVTADGDPAAAPADVAALLAGPVRQVGWLLGGRFALRGCGVEVAGRAVVVTGAAAAGKSAVAAALARRGHGLLADGALPVDVAPAPVAERVDDGVHLWPRAAALLGLTAEAGEPVRPGLAKRRYRWPAGPAGPFPVAAVAVLGRIGDAGAVSATPAAGLDAVDALLTYTAMRPVVAPLGLAARHFRWCAALAGAVPVVHVWSDRFRDDLARVADAVEALAGTGR
jgi:hypothetical protein